LDKAHDTACGPDDIHYQFLPEDAEIAEIVRCRMFSEPSFDPFAIVDGVFAIIIKPWFTRVTKLTGLCMNRCAEKNFKQK
jgi:hypothetical protein